MDPHPYLAGLHPLAIRFGLERMERALDALAHPERGYDVLHVGGTNGKGSTCAMAAAALRAAGHRVGLYTSPHLVRFNERVEVDGAPISDAALGAVVGEIRRACPWHDAGAESDRLTYFEFATLVGLLHLARERVRVAVVEVGLGGRFDATNAVVPRVTAIARIGLDHTQLLGDTVEQIAFEKAGIFKAGVPAVVGEPEIGIRDLLVSHAKAHDATPVRVVFGEFAIEDVAVTPDGTRFNLRRENDVRMVRTPLVGRHQAHNAAVALTMLEELPPDLRPDAATVERGLRNVSLPGRFQRVGKHIFDVAHNRDGARVFARTLAETKMPRPVTAVFSVLSDKDWASMMSALAPHVDLFILTNTPTAPASRAWNVADVMAYARSHGWGAEVVRDFDRALARAAEVGETVLVTGSFHTVGDAMVRLNVSPTP